MSALALQFDAQRRGRRDGSDGANRNLITFEKRPIGSPAYEVVAVAPTAQPLTVNAKVIESPLLLRLGRDESGPLATLTIVFGIFPKPVLDLSAAAVARLIDNYNQALTAAKTAAIFPAAARDGSRAIRRKLPKAPMVGLARHRHVSFNCCAISSLLAFVTFAYSMVD